MLPYVKLFPDLTETVAAMDDAMAGRLLKAVLAYAGGVVPTLTGPEKFVFLMLKSQFDRDAEQYRAMQTRNAENGAKGGRPRKNPALAENPENPVGFFETQKSQEEEKEKEEDKEYIYIAAASAGARVREGEITGDLDPGRPDPLVIYISSNLTGINADTLDDILAFRERMGDELIKEAVTETLRSGGHTVKYVLAILTRWDKAGFKTVGEIRAAEDKRKQDKARAAPAAAKPAKPMITREISEEDFSDSFAELMNRPRAAGEAH